MKPRKNVYRLEHLGIGLGHVAGAFLAGAAAGALAAVLTGTRTGAENRRRLRMLVDDTRNAAARVPEALRKASLAAREALGQALAEEAVQDEGMRAA